MCNKSNNQSSVDQDIDQELGDPWSGVEKD
jgi:hypothetical protein